MRREERGFTLIELLIVVVIIGLLAAIILPEFGRSKERAYIAQMRGDLRNLVTAQESYAAERNGAFYNGPVPDPALMFNPTGGVTIALSNVTASGWAATASYPGRTARTCAVYFGNAGPIGAATVEGAVACQ